MTPDQMAELAARLRVIAPLIPIEGCLAHEITLNQAADLIESMAQRVPLSDYEALMLLQELDPRITTVYPGYLAIIRATERHHGIRSEK